MKRDSCAVKMKIEFIVNQELNLSMAFQLYQLCSCQTVYYVLRQRGTTNSIGQLTLPMDIHRDSRLSLVQLPKLQ